MSRVWDDALEVLQALPNLLYLYFYEDTMERNCIVEKDAFQNSGNSLRCATELNDVIIDEGALPVVEELINV